MKIFRRSNLSSQGNFSPKAVVPLGSFAAVKPLTQKELEATMKEIGSKVQPWDSTRIVLVKPLQDAARNHGQVQLMKDTAAAGDGMLMAVKRMPTRWMCMGPADFDLKYPTASEKPWQDIGFVQHLGSVGFPYVCQLHDVFRSDSETFVATSFCSEGDLFGWCDLESVPEPGTAREEHMRPIVVQIFTAIRWLHDLGIAHRDLSLENILLTEGDDGEMKVKIIDFGMSTLRRTVRNEIRGKNSYQAPEMHGSVDVDTFLADGFSLGVTVFAMAVQDYPWTCTKRGKCQLFEYVSQFGLKRFLGKRRLRKGKGEYLVDVMSADLVEALDSLLHFEPKHRGGIGEAAFKDEVKRKKRKNVWDMAYLRDANAAPSA